MEMKETQLVAFYVSKLSPSNQVHLYAKYLQNIVDDEERKSSLRFAEDSGLDVLATTKQVMENIRNVPYEMNADPILQVNTEIHSDDQFINIERYMLPRHTVARETNFGDQNYNSCKEFILL